MRYVGLFVRQPHESCTQHQQGQGIVGQRSTKIKGIDQSRAKGEDRWRKMNW